MLQMHFPNTVEGRGMSLPTENLRLAAGVEDVVFRLEVVVCVCDGPI